MQIDKQTKRKTDEERLNDMGEQVRKHREDEHLKRKTELEKKLNEMKTQLDQKIVANKTEEEGQYKLFENADTQYKSSVQTYDDDLNQ